MDELQRQPNEFRGLSGGDAMNKKESDRRKQR